MTGTWSSESIVSMDETQKGEVAFRLLYICDIERGRGMGICAKAGFLDEEALAGVPRTSSFSPRPHNTSQLRPLSGFYPASQPHPCLSISITRRNRWRLVHTPQRVNAVEPNKSRE